jgi:putative flavoprotein involved in K+ transport
MADWIEAYAKVMQLNVWEQSSVQSSHFNEESKEWAVTVLRPGGESVTLRPKHLVLASGFHGAPRTPAIEGAETFTGLQYHSTAHRSEKHDFNGQKCIVVGANTSGHDIFQDLWEHGADVTMVQRSPTLVIRSKTFCELYVDPLFSEPPGLSRQQADVMVASIPLRLVAPFQGPLVGEALKRDADLHERLRKVGFGLHNAEDNTGFGPLYYRRFSGY